MVLWQYRSGTVRGSVGKRGIRGLLSLRRKTIGEVSTVTIKKSLLIPQLQRLRWITVLSPTTINMIESMWCLSPYIIHGG